MCVCVCVCVVLLIMCNFVIHDHISINYHYFYYISYLFYIYIMLCKICCIYTVDLLYVILFERGPVAIPYKEFRKVERKYGNNCL